jgi:hypothetical protein
MANHHDSIQRFPRRSDWEDSFDSFEDFENAPPISFSIEGFLQNDSATIIGGLSGHGKTLILLSMVRALLGGKHTKLWNYFEVRETASRVLYLIPESTITPFKDRLRRFRIYDHLRDGRLMVRTLSKGPAPCLVDPKLLAAAKGAHVFLDSVVRFVKGSENEAADNERGLASDIFALLGAGARTVVGAHHSPKSFAKENAMTLENVLRGSGDIGAMLSTAWGIKQLDPQRNIIHIENLKPRDFEPCGPFQIIGRPYIDEKHDFSMYKKPGECKSLQEELKGSNKGGASAKEREQRLANINLLHSLMRDHPNATAPELSALFEKRGIKLKPVTIRSYRAELNKATWG